MSEHKGKILEQEEIESLLPWYVTGSLDAADTARVVSYLAQHPHLSAQLDNMRAEREQIVIANEALLPSVGALNRLMASLPAVRPSLMQRVSGSAPYRLVADFFMAPTARAVRLAALAMAALVTLQAVVLTIVLRDGYTIYHTASGPLSGEGVSALVVFADDARAAAIAGLLAEFDANIVDGPKPGGVYKIRLRTVDRSQQAKDALLRRLAERSDMVRIVLPSRD